ncbi:MAG TPA: hypothetical protein VNJ01_02170 [Bacteriovoracaceae bacterium]|nr:hypothetical protein [Bacteriovoracaceae bacterium]
MKYLFLFLTISVAQAMTPPGCDQLSTIAQRFEKELMSKNLKISGGKDCKDAAIESVKKELDEQRQEGSKEFPLPTHGTALNLFSKHKCSSLSVIDLEIEQLRSEESLLSGIDKLKAKIQTTQDGTKNPELEKAQQSGQKFVEHLRTAQTLELLFKTGTQSANGILLELRKVDSANRNSLEKFSAVVAGLCPQDKTKSKNANDACNPQLFKPNPEAITAINHLIDSLSGKPSEKAKDTNTVDTWLRALAIKRKGAVAEDKEVYTFTQMQSDLASAIPKLEKKEKLTREELRAISSLDQFENANGLEFLTEMATARRDLKSAESNFEFLVEDLANRQAQELQSKISLTWSHFKGQSLGFTDAEVALCNTASVTQTSLDCLNFMASKMPQKFDENSQQTLGVLTKVDFDQMIKSIEGSKSYYEKLTALRSSCLSGEEKDKAKLVACFSEVNKDQAEVREQINALHLLREKIHSENEELLVSRNFALEQMILLCKSSSNSNIEGCESDFENKISPEATVLKNDVMGISVVFSPRPDSLTRMEALCATKKENGNKVTTPTRDQLCAFFDVKPAPFVAPEPARPSTSPDDPNPKIDYLGMGAKIFSDTLTQFVGQKFPPPFPPNPTPYNTFMPSARGPALHEQILMESFAPPRAFYP